VLFGVVAAGEVHPQPQLLLFGKAGKAFFDWWDPLPIVEQQPALLLIVLSKLFISLLP